MLNEDDGLASCRLTALFLEEARGVCDLRKQAPSCFRKPSVHPDRTISSRGFLSIYGGVRKLKLTTHDESLSPKDEMPHCLVDQLHILTLLQFRPKFLLEQQHLLQILQQRFTFCIFHSWQGPSSRGSVAVQAIQHVLHARDLAR